jgi:peptide/nickel transport system ATP-binding protein
MTPILDVADLRTEFRIGGRWHAAVDGISLTLDAGETLALVGESGCGKSVTALSIMGLLPAPAGRIEGGSIRLAGTELVGMSEALFERVRGDRVAMIFQGWTRPGRP